MLSPQNQPTEPTRKIRNSPHRHQLEISALNQQDVVLFDVAVVVFLVLVLVVVVVVVVSAAAAAAAAAVAVAIVVLLMTIIS